MYLNAREIDHCCVCYFIKIESKDTNLAALIKVGTC